MDGNRRLGWIAIGIGLLALMVSLGGRGREMRMGWHDGYGQQSPGYGQEWRGPYAPMDGFAPQALHGPMDGFAQRGPFGRGFDGYGPHRFMLFPMFLFGLFKLMALAALVFVVARMIRRRRHGGPHGHHDHHGPHGPESYTGKTTNL